MKKIDYDNMGRCLEKILEVDRYNWDRFRESFVLALVEFGYGYCVTEDELRWYNDYLANGNENHLGIDDYTW